MKLPDGIRRLGPPRLAAEIPGALLVALILLVGGRGAPALAQRVDESTVQEFIDRNDEMIQTGRIQIDNSGSPAARRVMGEASILHLRSQNLLAQGRLELALQVARRARAAILLAVRLSREDLSFHERYSILEERVRELQEVLEDKAGEGGNQAALDILARAEQQSRQAQDRFGQGDAKLAFKLLESAEQMQHRASRLVAETWSPERLDAEIDRIRQVIDSARTNAAGTGEAPSAALLAEAEHALERAIRFRDEGRPGLALPFLILAQRLAARSLSPAGPRPDSDTIQWQIDRWDGRVGALTERTGGAGAASSAELLERARQHRRRAAESLAKGDNLVALQQIKVAHDLLDLLEDN